MTVNDYLDITTETTGDYTERVTGIEGYLEFTFTPTDPLLLEILGENDLYTIAHDEILEHAGDGVHLPESAISLSVSFEPERMVVRASVDDSEMESTEVTDEDAAYEDARSAV